MLLCSGGWCYPFDLEEFVIRPFSSLFSFAGVLCCSVAVLSCFLEESSVG
jgi:hypothetical protein